MVEIITDLFWNTWSLVAVMAPYLLIGFAIAGLLHGLLRADFIDRFLGKPGLGGVVNASLFGVPMPLCSCSVIPIAASLRKSGASRGATASFMSSTPQTGIDSIMATYSLLGGAFTLVRVVVAFICGIVTGYLIELFCREKPKPAVPDMANLSFSPSTDAVDTASTDCCSATKPKRDWRECLRYGFVTLPGDLAGALLFGLFLAGLITTFITGDLLQDSMSSGPLAFLFATLISLPLYVCATASIPMAYALIAAGLSPGAALVFLITGPATNTATIVTVWKMLGRKATAIYLLSLLVISWLAGALFNASLSTELSAMAMHHDAHDHTTAGEHISGILLTGLLLFTFVRSRKKQEKSCCCS
ncbi:MAG: SO_0444 family Cu/Zn efflux transporter [Verrucomicrobiota bacterium]